ncbi:hypothetical protein D3C72_989570 [compost metagenome]
MRIAWVVDIVFRRQRRKRQKTAPGTDKRKQQPGGGERVFHRCRQRKAKRDQGIEQKIEGDIEKTARVRQAATPRQCAVQPVKQAVQHNRDQRRRVPAERQKRQCQYAEGKARKRHAIRRDEWLIDDRHQAVERRFNARMQMSVKHEADL